MLSEFAAAATDQCLLGLGIAIGQQARAGGERILDILDSNPLIVERPDATPNPAVEVRESLPDGTEFKAVWSHLRQSGVAKLVTVHFFDRG